MHQIFAQINNELAEVENALRASLPSGAPLSQLTGGFGVAGVSLTDCLRRPVELRKRLLEADPSDIHGAEDAQDLLIHVTSLQHLRTQTVPQMSSANATLTIPAFFLTFDALERALAPYLELDRSQALKNVKATRRVASQIRGLEGKLRELSPKAASVQSMVDQIERAYEAADQLPADLEMLSEARQRIGGLSVEAEKDRAQVLAAKEAIDAAKKNLDTIATNASAILSQCESVYSSATSVGLAAAFAERSKQLDFSMWIWVAGLVGSLVLGGIFGSAQLHELGRLMASPTAPQSLLALNGALSLLSIGAPIWFAWLSTKQIGQRFRISEDYAFKASISRAYEGYRREAARIDTNLEAQLLGSALSRLDEQPLRLVEAASHGSPWQDLLSSELIKDAARSVPGFVEKVTKLAGDSLDRTISRKTTVTPLAANSEITPVADAVEKLPV